MESVFWEGLGEKEGRREIRGKAAPLLFVPLFGSRLRKTLVKVVTVFTSIDTTRPSHRIEHIIDILSRESENRREKVKREHSPKHRRPKV